MPQFTVETAAQMAERSHAAQRKAKEQRELILASPPQVTVELVKDCLSQRLERTRKQIELIDDMLDQCDDADTIDALTRSKERLFRIWAHCAGIPGPGNLKPTQSRQSQRRTWIEPTPSPEPTTGSVQPGQPEPTEPKP